MPLPQTSKEKSARLDWGYFRRPSRVGRVRTWLWVVAAVAVAGPLVAATALVAWSGDVPGPLAAAASRGPLASPHAAWDDRCEACHEPFTPIGPDRWFGRLTGHAGGDPVRNVRCEQCHAAPPHHPAQKPDAVPGCADCHHEHRGRDASLVRLADESCVRCHGDLAAHRSFTPPEPVAARVTGFSPATHSGFRAVDPAGPRYTRTLKFSHATHMAAGLSAAPARPRVPGEVRLPFTFADIEDPTARRRYTALQETSDATALVQLDCAACHQLDAGRMTAAGPLGPREQFAELGRELLRGQPREAVQPPRAGGKHFLPVNFDLHCRACHPLTFDEAPDLRRVEAPHRVQPDDLDSFLRQVYAQRFLADGLARLPGPDRGAGRLDRPLGPDASAEWAAWESAAAVAGTALAVRTLPLTPEQVRREVEAFTSEKVAAAKRELLLGGKACLQCHVAGAPEPGATTAAAGLPVRIVPPRVPTVWLPRASFDHTAHRAVRCDQCHPRASFGRDAEERAAREYAAPAGPTPAAHYRHPPDLPGLSACAGCHAPAGGARDAPTGGVRHGCTDCHTYHRAGHGLQGRAATAREPGSRLSSAEVLSGRRGR